MASPGNQHCVPIVSAHFRPCSLRQKLFKARFHCAQLITATVGQLTMFQHSYWLTSHVTCRCHDDDADIS